VFLANASLFSLSEGLEFSKLFGVFTGALNVIGLRGVGVFVVIWGLLCCACPLCFRVWFHIL